MNIYRRLWNDIGVNRGLVNGTMGFSFLLAAFELMPSVLTKPLIDDAIYGKNEQLLWAISWALVALLILRTIAHYTRMRYTGKLAQCVLYDLRTRLYEHLQTLSMSFYQNKRTGQIMSRVTGDVGVLEQFIQEGIRDGSVNVLKMVIIAAILCWTNWELTLLTLIPTVPLAWATSNFSKRIHTSYRTMRRRLADMNSILSDTITGIRVVQVFGQEEAEAQKFRTKSKEFQEAGLTTNALQAIYMPGVNFAFVLGQVIVWLVGGREVIHGQLSAGDLIMFSGLVAQFYAPVQVLSNMSNLFANTAASAERVYEILDTQPDIQTASAATPLPNVKGEVVFDNVSFGYDSSEPALQNISLRVAPGETVGLVGPSGSGKSTLVSLISRFYDVTDGSVKIDGRDVRDVDLSDLRASVSAVLQDPYLFHGTIRDNISYGKPKADFEQVVDAARAANAHDFIMKLPDAYDTHVGERGVKLSGGERQRISIARAILDDPQILILDEATSAVDTESEVQIQGALDNLMQGRTTLAIAHRLSTVKNADKLVVLEDGHIVEMGTHDELIEREDGLYRRLVDMQLQLGQTLGE